MLQSLRGKIRFLNFVNMALVSCLLILQFTPFWHYSGKTTTINGYVWLNPGDTEITKWFASQLGTTPEINSIVMSSVLILLSGIVSVILCIKFSKVGQIAIAPAICGIVRLYTYLAKPVFKLGSNWWLHLILSIAILLIAITTLVLHYKTSGQEIPGNVAVSKADKESRIALIKALGEVNHKKPEDNNKNFNKLLNWLNDSEADYRMVAAETLGKTSRDAAFTHISHKIESETNERVIKVMRQALVSIRENMQNEHTERA